MKGRYRYEDETITCLPTGCSTGLRADDLAGYKSRGFDTDPSSRQRRQHPTRTPDPASSDPYATRGSSYTTRGSSHTTRASSYTTRASSHTTRGSSYITCASSYTTRGSSYITRAATIAVRATSALRVFYLLSQNAARPARFLLFCALCQIAMGSKKNPMQEGNQHWLFPLALNGHTTGKQRLLWRTVWL
jgi:hypothetical protein